MGGWSRAAADRAVSVLQIDTDVIAMECANPDGVQACLQPPLQEAGSVTYSIDVKNKVRWGLCFEILRWADSRRAR